MPNGTHTFKFQGKTYGRDAIFVAGEAAARTYHAFGRQKTFLSKLVAEGFVVQGKYAFHPNYWTPLKEYDGWNTHFRVSKRTGNKIMGRPCSAEER